MVVPSYVRADNWTKTHLVALDLEATLCGQERLEDAVNLRDANAPDIGGDEPYCAECEAADAQEQGEAKA